MTTPSPENQRAIDALSVYIQKNTAHPNPTYGPALEFLRGYAASLGLPTLEVHTPSWLPDAPPIGLITVPGRDPTLQSVLLNSHMDVVPVAADRWTPGIDPFGGQIIEGKIFGRGAQDMKCITIQHMEAVSRLLKSNGPPLRTIHLCFIPDEEVGGQKGMKPFVKTERFRALNVGVELDEGLASPSDEYLLYHSERIPRWAVVEADGPTGHGSQFFEGTAVEKVMKVVDRVLQYQTTQREYVKTHADVETADVCTINTTFLEAGPVGHAVPELNVVPAHARVGFDMRLTPAQFTEMMQQFQGWVEEAGCTVQLKPPTEEILLEPKTAVQSPTSGPFWEAITDALDHHGCAWKECVFPASTDARYIRRCGIPAYGFSPMHRTPVLLHDNDESLELEVFTTGIDILQTVIRNVASVKDIAPPSISEDWTCTSCGNINYGRRVICNRCTEPKPQTQPPSGSTGPKTGSGSGSQSHGAAVSVSGEEALRSAWEQEKQSLEHQLEAKRHALHQPTDTDGANADASLSFDFNEERQVLLTVHDELQRANAQAPGGMRDQWEAELQEEIRRQRD